MATRKSYKETGVETFLWDEFNAIRSSGSFDMNSASSWLAVLYCKARKASVKLHTQEKGLCFLTIDEDILEQHPVLAKLSTAFELKFDESFLLCIKRVLEFDDNLVKRFYPEIVDGFLNYMSAQFGKSGMMEYAQPEEVTRVICDIIEHAKCTRIYNPFAGMCSYAIRSNRAHYIGEQSIDVTCTAQELSPQISAYALLRLDANKCRHTDLIIDDSINHWLGNSSFDAIIATPPFGLILKQYPDIFPNCRYAEDFFLNKCSENPPAKYAICVVSSSYCSRISSKDSRQRMLEDGSLDMVIDLPRGLFAGTGIGASIIVRSFGEKHSEVRFVDASTMVKSDSSRKKLLDNYFLESVLYPNRWSYYPKRAAKYVKTVSYEDIRRQAFSLDSTMYTATQEVPVGKHLATMESLAAIDRGSAVLDKHHYAFIVSRDDFKDSLDDALIPNNRERNEAPTASNKKHVGDAVVCSFFDNKANIFVHRGFDEFYSRPSQIVFKPKRSATSLEYLALLLLNNPQLNQMATRGITMMSVDNNALLSMQVLVDDDQQAAVDAALKNEREAKKKYLRSEGERLGLSSDVNDLVHMLGTSFTNQGEVFNYLQSPERHLSKDVALGIYALKEISDYMYRMITSFGQDLSVATYSRSIVKPTEFLTQFMNSWQFIGRKEFSLRLLPFDEYMKEVTISADSDKLKLLLETLLDNAYRHGFKKGDLKVPDGNQAAIMLELVTYHDKVYLRIAVMNNGAPLADGFTVKDFVKKGRFSKESGNTGLGGNHVYSITKAHDGYLALTSDSEWNFIVEVLIPTVGLPNSLPSNTNEYESECL